METTRVATAMGATAGNKDGDSAFICPAQSAPLKFTYGTINFAVVWIYSSITPFDTRI